MRELSDADLAAMGFRKRSPEEHAKLQVEYEAQLEAIPKLIRERAEARMDAGWQMVFAFEDALHHAANVGNNREATIQQMTIGASGLARGWDHSAAFVAYWNGLFPFADKVEGFACPATVELEDGRRAAIAAEWSTFLAQRKADG